MYDAIRYEVLLHRGLEYIDPVELQEMLGNKKQEKQLTLARKR